MKNLLLAIIAMVCLSQNAFAQCEGWGTPQDSMRTVTQHVLYRDYLKNAKDKSPKEVAEMYREALPFWKHCYKNAPAATKKHFKDGIKIYKAFFAVETDKAKQKPHLDMIYSLYDRRVQCFDNELYIRTRQLTDMFYYLNASQDEIYKLAKQITEWADNETESVVLLPLMSSAVYLFQQQKINQADLLQIRQKIETIIQHNIAHQEDEKIRDQYKKAKEQVDAQFGAVETGFDCSYYRPAIVAKYKADPDNKKVWEAVRQELIDKYCGMDDPIVQEITAKIKASNQQIRDEIDERNQAKLEKLNAPARKAKEAYQAGNYAEAIRLYESAIAETDNANKQADYYYIIASCYLNTKKYPQVRTYARKASALRPTWGKPYILIGKAYLNGACGANDWEKPLCYMAAVDKFRKAKSVDPSVSADADKWIGNYGGEYPPIEAAHSRSKKDGERVSTGCWINETVTLKTKQR